MATLLDLAARLEAKAKDVPKLASNRAIAAAKVLVDTVVWRTPVDTSKALSNWQVTLTAPAYNTIPPHAPGYHGYTQFQSAQAAIAAVERVLSTKKPGQTIFISNNVHYIRKLNNGFSRQAPAGFVEASVLVARSYLRNN